MELIVKDFENINVKKAAARKRRRSIRTSSKTSSSHPSSISAIISNILASSAANEDEPDKKGNQELGEETLEQSAEGLEDKKQKVVHGGYGAIIHYSGMSPDAKYTDYGRIWGHLGSFKSYNMHHNTESPNEIAMRNGESAMEMVGMETIEKAAKHFKYFVRGEVLGDIGYVPAFGLGIDSKEWEKYRLMTQISFYRPLLKLMHSVI